MREFIDDAIRWLNTNDGFVIAGLTFVLVLINIWYGWISRASLDLARQDRHQEAEGLRIMLGVELKGNLESLKRFWSEVNAPEVPDNPEPRAKTQLAARLITTPAPEWARPMWVDHAASVPGALKPDAIDRLRLFYGHLDQVIAVRERLRQIENRDEDRVQSAPVYDPFGGRAYGTVPMREHVSPDFPKLAPPLWDRCQKEVTKAIAIGETEVQ